MSSSILYTVQRYLSQIVGPIFLFFGLISCTLNLIVFGRSSLRKSPCSICFIFGNIIDLMYIFLSFIPTFLQNGYDINFGQGNLIYCRSLYYIGLILSSLGPSYLILASIDRTLITSRNAGIRKRSTIRLSIKSVIVLALFWMIFHIHALIYMKIIEFGDDYFVCTFEGGEYTIFITYYSLIVIGLSLPFLMIIFGFLTIKNVRKSVNVIQPSVGLSVVTKTVGIGRSNVRNSKEHQLIRILLMEIIIYIVARFPSTLFLLYNQISENKMKSVEQSLVEQYIANITYFIGFIDSCIGCYANILVSKTFRLELKRIFFQNRFVRYFGLH